MSRPKFFDKRGFCTRYSHACGYLDTARALCDDQHIAMGLEGACYFVKCRATDRHGLLWDTFDGDGAGRKAARKRFMQRIREEGAVRRIGREPK